ncbi:MAG TPA: FAD-binding oxidoreductase [Kofleriaceae bacterium]|nr:FAD-binding oxidoreductase [Kofleriaceae bacterium]
MARAAADPEVIRDKLAAIVGDRRVSLADTDLDAYSRDMWPRLLIGLRAGEKPAHRPQVVVWPESAREVAAIIKTANSLGVPVVPYGAGSGVCGGAVPLGGGITVDTKRMDRLVNVRREDMLCHVEAGKNGERFERELFRRGFTFGHFPSSIYCSTVGGWLATRAAGQMSTKYGKVEDRVFGVTFVTGDGEVIKTDGLARAGRGPAWTPLLLGSEGTLGIVTSARLRVAPAPELRVFRGFDMDDVQSGIEAIRRVMQRGLKPAVVRLYDERDTFINSMSILKSEPREASSEDRERFGPVPAPGDGALPEITMSAGAEAPRSTSLVRFAGRLVSNKRSQRAIHNLGREAMAAALARPRLVNAALDKIAGRAFGRGCRMIIGLEGSRIRTEVEARLTFGEIERAGGRDLGEEPGLEWYRHRYAVSYQMSKVFRTGAFVDTMEVASTWERLPALYRAVKAAIARHAFVMAHFSHAYSDGCSIYFTFIGHAPSTRESERLYDAIWRDGLDATTRVGGTISHHHGIGLLKSAYMTAEHREAMTLLFALKASMDPANIMNPGKLGLPFAGARL